MAKAVSCPCILDPGNPPALPDRGRHCQEALPPKANSALLDGFATDYADPIDNSCSCADKVGKANE